MTRRRAPSRSLVAAVLVVGCGVSARAQHPPPAAIGETPDAGVTIIDEQLDTRRALLVSIDERHVTIVDEQSQRRLLAREGVLAIVSEPREDTSTALSRRAPTRPPGFIELTDGQRLPGDLLIVARVEDAVAWNHPLLGQVNYPLERVLGFWREGTPMEQRASAFRSDDPPPSDLLFLTNGDRQPGYLVAVGDPVRLEVDGAPMEIGPDRVAGARLSNARTHAEGAWIWLDDGGAARVSRLTVDTAGRSSFSLVDGPTGSIRWDQVRAVVLDAGRIVPLSRLKPIEQKPAAGRRYAPPVREFRARAEDDPFGLLGPAMGAADLLLPGPMSITWSLPAGARRFAFDAALAPGAAPWGDCELTISIDGVEQARRRIYADQAIVPVTLAVTGRSLTISIEPGRFGPIRDWIVLRRPLILVTPQSPDRAD